MSSELSTEEQAGDTGYKRRVYQWIQSNLNVTHNSDLPTAPGESGLATKLYNACLQILQSLYRFSLAQKPLQAHTAILKEELAKLFLWGESFRPGELDEVLAFAKELREVVFEKFIEIGKLLLGLMKLPDFTEAKKVRSCRDLDAVLEEAKLIVVQRKNEDNQEESDTSSDYNSDDESHTATQDFGQIAKWLQTQTSQLARIGPAIRRSLARLEKEKFESRSAYPPVVSFQVSSAAGAYVSLIRDRFKDASPDLLERLGEANWQRHQNVRNASINSNAVFEPASTAVFRPASTFYDSGLGTSVPVRTSYAQSHTSFISSITTGEIGDLRVPPMPREAQLGKPFKCFLCKETLKFMKNRVDWKIHVFADLRPYICTFPGCKDELAQFSSRAEWGEHEFECHRFVSTWSCPDCPKTYSKVIDYEDHLKSKHGRQQDSVTWQAALDLALDKQENPAELEQCPLCCATPGSTRRHFVNHVARHMEQIALTALPRDVEESDDDVDRLTLKSSADNVSGSDDRISTTNHAFSPVPHAANPFPGRYARINNPTPPRSLDVRSNSNMAAKEKSILTSSAKWTTDTDVLILQARRQGLDWASIATKYFPDKTADACRKRFMRLKANDGALEGSDIAQTTDSPKATDSPEFIDHDHPAPKITENYEWNPNYERTFNDRLIQYLTGLPSDLEYPNTLEKYSSSKHRDSLKGYDALEASDIPKASGAPEATGSPDFYNSLFNSGLGNSNTVDRSTYENPIDRSTFDEYTQGIDFDSNSLTCKELSILEGEGREESPKSSSEHRDKPKE